MWAEWSKINIAMAFTAPVFWRVVRTPPEAQDWNQIRKAIAALETKLEIAEQQLTNHAYLAGPDFTLADIQFGHILYRYFDIDIDPRGSAPFAPLLSPAHRTQRFPRARHGVVRGTALQLTQFGECLTKSSPGEARQDHCSTCHFVVATTYEQLTRRYRL
jgi:glutathione S-transferase